MTAPASQTIVLVGDTEFREGDGRLESVKFTSGTGRKQPTQVEILLSDPFLKASNSLPLPKDNKGAPVEEDLTEDPEVYGLPVSEDSLPSPATDSRIPFEVYVDSGASEILPGFDIMSREGVHGVGYDSAYLLFAGYFQRLRTTISSDKKGYGKTSLLGIDKGRGLRDAQRVRILTSLSAHDILTEIARDSRLNLKYLSESDTLKTRLEGTQYAQYVARGTADIEILDDMLPALGCAYFVQSNVLYVWEVGQIITGIDGGPVDPVILTPGDGGNVASIQFEVEAQTRALAKNVYSVGGVPYDIADSDVTDAQRRAVRLERLGLSLDGENLPSFTDQTIELAAKAVSNKAKVFFAEIRLTGLLLGVWPGHQVLLRGVGPRWSGVWNVESVQHELLTPKFTTLWVYNSGAEDTTRDPFIGDIVYFQFDRTEIVGDTNLRTMERVLVRMQSTANRYTLTGHCDPRGTEAYNDGLGLRRAESVKAWLVARGISTARLDTATRGELELASSFNHGMNRRVEFHAQ